MLPVCRRKTSIDSLTHVGRDHLAANQVRRTRQRPISLGYRRWMCATVRDGETVRNLKLIAIVRATLYTVAFSSAAVAGGIAWVYRPNFSSDSRTVWWLLGAYAVLLLVAVFVHCWEIQLRFYKPAVRKRANDGSPSKSDDPGDVGGRSD